MATKAQKEKERLSMLHSMQEERKCVVLIALKLLRNVRQGNISIEDAATQEGIKHNLAAETLTTAAYLLQRARTKRLHRFRDHLIRKAYASGTRKTILAKHFNVTPHIINKILKDSNARTAIQANNPRTT